jgi:hypothetical protein
MSPTAPPAMASAPRPSRRPWSARCRSRNVARQWPSPYSVSCTSQPSRCIRTATWPTPRQESSQRWRASSAGCRGAARRVTKPTAARRSRPRASSTRSRYGGWGRRQARTGRLLSCAALDPTDDRDEPLQPLAKHRLLVVDSNAHVGSTLARNSPRTRTDETSLFAAHFSNSAAVSSSHSRSIAW